MRSAPSRCSTVSAAVRRPISPAIVDTLLRLSAMVCNHPEISELDINPLIVHAKGNGCSVADSRIMLKRPAAD